MLRHFTQAMSMNEYRRQLYAEVSDGQSLKVSDELLRFEKKMLFSARLADTLAYPFQVVGVPLFCRELVSMQLVPDFQFQSAAPWPDLKSYQRFDSQGYQRQVKEFLYRRDFSSVVEVSHQYLAELQQQPSFHCLQRHFVESVALAASIAEDQDRLAKRQLGLGTKGLSSMYIRTLLGKLDETNHLDELAAPLQAQGIPILCQDVPPVRD